MAQVAWNDYQERLAAQEARQANGGSDERSNIGFFSLKNDRDEAIVRFVYTSPTEFELIAAHTLRDATGRLRTYSCLREDPRDAMDMCPLCANGEKVGLKFYIKLIEYVRQADGTFVGVPKVWERSGAYAQKLAAKMTTYGPLTDCLFVVRRHGAAGSMKTEYDIDYLPDNPAYKKEGFEAFDDFKAYGRMAAVKTYEELMALVSGTSAPAQSTYTQAAAPAVPAYIAPTAPVYAATAAPMVDTPAVEAPVRTYREPTQPAAGQSFGSEDVRPKRKYW